MVVCVFVAESYIWSGFKMFRRHFLVSAKETYHRGGFGALRKGGSTYQKGRFFFTKGRILCSEKGGFFIIQKGGYLLYERAQS